jgi:hypothetical protein
MCKKATSRSYVTLLSFDNHVFGKMVFPTLSKFQGLKGGLQNESELLLSN